MKTLQSRPHIRIAAATMILVLLVLSLTACQAPVTPGASPTPTGGIISPATATTQASSSADPTNTVPLIISPEMPANMSLYRADYQRTGHYRTKGVSSYTETIWKFKAGDTVSAAPIVMSNTVYFGSNDRNFYAVDAATGAERWRVATEAQQGPDGPYGSIAAAAAVFNDDVYFTGADGQMHSVEAESGHESWKYKLAGNRWSAATVMADTLFVCDMRGLLALNIESGIPTEAWNFLSATDSPQGMGVTSPSIAGSAVFFGSSNGAFYSVDITSGKLNWRVLTGQRALVYSTAAIAGSLVYFAGGNDDNWHLYAVDVRSGQEAWKYQLNSPSFSPVAAADGKVFFVSGDYDSAKRSVTSRYIHAVDGATGQDKWRFDAEEYVSTAVSVADSIAYFGTDQKLYALDINSGDVKWTLEVPGGVSSDITIADGVIYFSSGENYIYAVR